MLAYIYKINITETEFYIGSTVDVKHRTRMHNETFHCKNHKDYNMKVYRALRETGIDLIELEIIYTFECKDVDEKRKTEQLYMDEYNPTLNVYRAYNSEEYKKHWHQQRYINNKAEFNAKSKIWREKNKDIIKEKQKLNKEKVKARQSQLITCECGCEIRRGEKARHRKSKKHEKLMSQH